MRNILSMIECAFSFLKTFVQGFRINSKAILNMIILQKHNKKERLNYNHQYTQN